MLNNTSPGVNLAAVIVSVIENLAGELLPLSEARWASQRRGAGDPTFPWAPSLLIRPDASYFLFSRATEDSFERSSPLAALSEQSLLHGTTAGSPLLSWIKWREETGKSFFFCLSFLNICQTAVHRREEGVKKKKNRKRKPLRRWKQVHWSVIYPVRIRALQQSLHFGF